MSKTMTQHAPQPHTNEHLVGRSSIHSLPPEYDSHEAFDELDNYTPSQSNTSLPTYNEILEQPSRTASSSLSGPTTSQLFHPTQTFQIEARGQPMLALPLPLRPDPIEIYAVGPDGEVAGLAYRSLRESRRSNSCTLVRGEGASDAPLCSTTYRFGPGRPPTMKLHAPNASDEEFEVLSRGCATRSQRLRTHLGTIEWRYGGREERREDDAHSLLVLDHVATVACIGGQEEERRRPVARLVRNTEFRSQGSRSSTAGNGGRLLMDLRAWADSKGEVEQMELMVLSSCLVMLKKEVDRRRLLQAAVIAGGG